MPNHMREREKEDTHLGELVAHVSVQARDGGAGRRGDAGKVAERGGALCVCVRVGGGVASLRVCLWVSVRMCEWVNGRVVCKQIHVRFMWGEGPGCKTPRTPSPTLAPRTGATHRQRQNSQHTRSLGREHAFVLYRTNARTRTHTL